MSELMINRTPDVIAAEINSIKEQTRRIMLFNSIEIGRKLVEAKDLIEHGQWGMWLEKSVEYSQSTANNLMKIFQEYGSEQITLIGDNSKSQALGNLSYTQAVELLRLPEDERETFVEENDIEHMPTRELKQAIKDKLDLEAKLKNIEEELIAEREANQTIQDNYNTISENNKRNMEKTQELNKELEELRKEKESLEEQVIENKNDVEKYKKKMDKYKAEIEEAKKAGNDEEVERLQGSLKEAENQLLDSNEKIKELEEKLSNPIEPVVVEKVPEAIEREIEELKAKLQKSEIKEALQNNPQTKEFVSRLEILKRSFGDLLVALNGIEDSKEYSKCKNATSKLVSIINEKLQEE